MRRPPDRARRSKVRKKTAPYLVLDRARAREIRDLRREVAALRERVLRLAPAADELADLVESPFDRWVREHPADVARLRGKFVAFHDRDGVLVDDDDLDAVVRYVKARGLVGQVLLAGIPAFPG